MFLQNFISVLGVASLIVGMVVAIAFIATWLEYKFHEAVASIFTIIVIVVLFLAAIAWTITKKQEKVRREQKNTYNEQSKQ